MHEQTVTEPPSLVKRIRPIVLGTLAAGILYLVRRFTSWRYRAPTLEDLARQPAILCFWHGQQLMMPWFAPYMDALLALRPLRTLISEHSDGRIIATAIRWFGIGDIAGSSTHGGRSAAREIVSALKRGDNVVITPDGPRGPPHSVKEGVIWAAHMSGAPIYPMAYAASSFWRFRSWDQMTLPKPFSRIAMQLGEPLIIPRDTRRDQYAELGEALAKRLHDLAKRCEDELCAERPS